MPFIKLWLTKILNTLQNSGFSFPLDFHFKNLKKGILGLEEVHRSETMMVDQAGRDLRIFHCNLILRAESALGSDHIAQGFSSLVLKPTKAGDSTASLGNLLHFI